MAVEKCLPVPETAERRCIRLRDAPRYLGMDPNRFNEEVRPQLIEIPIGDRGIGFDRLDLDAWFDEYKARNGRPGNLKKGGPRWDKKSRGVYSCETASGTSGKGLGKAEFAKAVKQVICSKRKGSSSTK